MIERESVCEKKDADAVDWQFFLAQELHYRKTAIIEKLSFDLF